MTRRRERFHSDALDGGQAPADDPDLGMVHANMNEYLELERQEENGDD